MKINSTEEKLFTYELNNIANTYHKIDITLKVIGTLSGKVMINNLTMGEYKFDESVKEKTIISSCKLPINSLLTLENQYGDGSAEILAIDCMEVAKPEFKFPKFELSNKNAQANAKALMKYFSSTYTKYIISGQHIPEHTIPEIYEATGKKPAIKSFDYLGLGQGTKDVPEATEHCLWEIENTAHNTQRIIDWVMNDGGIATSCWHWFSPLNGVNKRFYTEFSDFDASKAATPGTAEYDAINSDLELVAIELKKLCDLKIPLLWRPFHEADGGWFWWGAKGKEPYLKLWKHMYNRFVNEFHLDNLIWVWNAPQDGWYVGDEYCDIVGNDIYNQTDNHGTSTEYFYENLRITGGNKPVTMSENGPLPDPDELIKYETPWLYFTTWGWSPENIDNKFFRNSTEFMQKIYNHPYVITLEKLPKLFEF